MHRLITDCLDTETHTHSFPILLSLNWSFLGFQEVKSKPWRGASFSQGQAKRLTLVSQTSYLNLVMVSTSISTKWSNLFHRDAKATS